MTYAEIPLAGVRSGGTARFPWARTGRALGPAVPAFPGVHAFLPRRTEPGSGGVLPGPGHRAGPGAGSGAGPFPDRTLSPGTRGAPGGAGGRPDRGARTLGPHGDRGGLHAHLDPPPGERGLRGAPFRVAWHGHPGGRGPGPRGAVRRGTLRYRRLPGTLHRPLLLPGPRGQGDGVPAPSSDLKPSGSRTGPGGWTSEPQTRHSPAAGAAFGNPDLRVRLLRR
ncbi:MAG: hypothetical protein MZU97_11990 [Bacillus subtilis]|nr:hypothetical protein [Bacillus subtilis]